jgi:alkylated DNA repair protein alkB homolog 7
MNTLLKWESNVRWNVYLNRLKCSSQSVTLMLFLSRRYEQGHWDSVIQKYREVELLDEDADELTPLLQPIRHFIEENHSSDEKSNDTYSTACFSGSWLPCHAIDLHQDGALNAHVDSIRFSGNIVAGLSLLSDGIMRLKLSSDKESTESKDSCATSVSDHFDGNEFVDLLLPCRSLYVLRGVSRYEFTHEMLPSNSLFRNSIPIKRDRRLSIIFRDSKK